jgi:hypothetical protein
MRFYNQQHRFYCGVDLHARSMFTHMLEASGGSRTLATRSHQIHWTGTPLPGSWSCTSNSNFCRFLRLAPCLPQPLISDPLGVIGIPSRPMFSNYSLATILPA